MKPGQNILLRLHNLAPWKGRTIHHDHLKAKRTRGVQLGACADAARIFGDDHINSVTFQKRQIASQIKRSGCDFNSMVGQGNAGLGLIHQTQKVMMLRGDGEQINVLLPDRQEHPLRGFAKGPQYAWIIRNMLPVIAFLSLPWRAFKADQGRSGLCDSLQGIVRHLCSERMGCIHNMRDFFSTDVFDQTCDATKATHAGRQGLAARRIGAPGVGKYSVCFTVSQVMRKARGLCCAAQDKDFLHV